MTSLIGITAIVLMTIVILIAAASLLFVGTLPLAKLRARRRSDRDRNS